MKILLLCVGKTDLKWVEDGIKIYLDRLVHYGKVEMVCIPALKGVSAMTKEQIKSKEGEMILKNLASEDYVVLLDENGTQYSSVEFSSFISGAPSRCARGRLVFVIGGAYGFSKEVYDRKNHSISLSRMTFSHQMVRVIFLEQLYRAFTIIEGEPYHHA